MMNISVRQILLLSFLFFSSAGFAADVTLNITGTIKAAACQVSSSSQTQNINLGSQIKVSELSSAGSTTAFVPFSINLVNCPQGTTGVNALFSGTSDPDSVIDSYKNTGTATNVSVQLQTEDGIPLGAGARIFRRIENNALTLNLKSRVYSHNGGGTVGTIKATVTVDFTYE